MEETSEKKAVSTASKTRKTAAKDSVAAVSASEATSSLEKMVEEEFKKEFHCLPDTSIEVVVRCGDRRTPTYQEVELDSVKQFILSILKKG